MLRNCKECGKVFSHPSQTLCAHCSKVRSEEFIKVKDYLQSYPNAPLGEVASATEVSIESIEEFIRQGRLTVIPKGANVTCAVCGKAVPYGRVCAACRGDLKGKEPIEQVRNDKESAKSRLHTMDTLRRRY